MFSILIQQLKFILILLIAYGLSTIIRPKMRKKIFPFIPALFLTSMICSIFLPDSRIFGYLFMAGMYSCIMFLLDIKGICRLKRSIFFILFLAFYLYYDIVNFYAPFLNIGLLAKHGGFIMYFLPGIISGIFIVKSDSFPQVTRWVTIATIFITFVYWGSAVQVVDVEHGGRAEMEGLNSNLLGMFMVALFIFCILCFVDTRQPVMIRTLAGFATLLSLYILVMTGSRNSFVGAVVSLFMGVNASRRYRMFNIVLVVVLLMVGGLYFSKMYDVRDIRVLNKENFEDDSGRMGWWTDRLVGTTFWEQVFGHGSYYDDSRAYEGTILHSNMHGMYFQIYYEMGILGCILFFLYVVGHIVKARQNKPYGYWSLSLLACALACGIAESYPLRGGTLSFIWGISIGLLLLPSQRVYEQRIPLFPVNPPDRLRY